MVERADNPDIARSRHLIERSRRILVLTGAGISTDSGIADFRGPNGIWTKNPEAERAATLSVYVSEPAVRRRSWRQRLTSPMTEARPNAGHVALVALEHSGRLDTLVTQNIDGLHQKAGSDPAAPHRDPRQRARHHVLGVRATWPGRTGARRECAAARRIRTVA